MGEFPLAVPPVVDFSKPVTPLSALLAQRQRAQLALRDIEAAQRDILNYNREAQAATNAAVAWGATMFMCDLVRNSLVALDRRAGILFGAMDREIENGRKVLQIFGRRTITKDDLLKSVDPNLQTAVKSVALIRKTKSVLEKAKVKVPKEARVLVDIFADMADDTILLMQANQTLQQVNATTNSALSGGHSSLLRVRRQIMRIDAELTRLIEMLQRQQNVA